MRGRTASANQSRDLAFAKRLLQSANTRRLPHAIDIFNRGLLLVVHLHIARLDLTLEQPRQFQVGDKVESAAEVVALDFAHFAPLPKQSPIASGLDRARASPTIQFDKRQSELLHDRLRRRVVFLDGQEVEIQIALIVLQRPVQRCR